MINNLARTDIEQLIKKYKNSICKLAYSYLKNMDDVQDAYQSVFENYFKSMPQFSNEEHEKAWFLRTTANVCKNICTTAWKKRVSVIDDYSNHELFFEDDKNTSFELFEEIMNLPYKYRVVIHLFYYEEYPITEIAKILGITVSTVKTRLNRARNMLKKNLLQCDEISAYYSCSANSYKKSISSIKKSF